MSHFIVAITNQVERTKSVSLRNNEQQNLRQAQLKNWKGIFLVQKGWSHKRGSTVLNLYVSTFI